MIDRIHLDPKLEKCLTTLKKGSRRASLAADRVEAIIAALRRGDTPTDEVCAYTRNGEARIKGCRKFNLGAGYRLVTLKQGDDLYLLYAGTHDECARWVDNNREHLPLAMIAERSRTVKRSRPGSSASGQRSGQPTGAAPDEDWLPPVDERDLRIIFSGLVDGR